MVESDQTARAGRTGSGIDPNFGEKVLRCFADPKEYGVHLLFNDWWAEADAAAIAAYEAALLELPGGREFVEKRYFAEPLELGMLECCTPGSIGCAYHKFLIENDLEKNLATNYRALHEFTQGQGKLDRMPDSLRYAIIRGFQQHDMMHVLTGYQATPDGELALQAFCLAQLNFPYFAMWMTVSTARMTLLDPKAITPTMDAIAHGWTHGRGTRNIQFVRWEERLDQSLEQVRKEFALNQEQPAS